MLQTSQLGYPYSQVRDFFLKIFEDLQSLTEQAAHQQQGEDIIREPTVQDQPVEQPVQVEHYSPVIDQPDTPFVEQGEDVLIDIPLDMQEELLLQHLEEQSAPTEPVQQREESEADAAREIQALIPWEAPEQAGPQESAGSISTREVEH